MSLNHGYFIYLYIYIKKEEQSLGLKSCDLFIETLDGQSVTWEYIYFPFLELSEPTCLFMTLSFLKSCVTLTFE